jgi:hypothetical protein
VDAELPHRQDTAARLRALMHEFGTHDGVLPRTPTEKTGQICAASVDRLAVDPSVVHRGTRDVAVRVHVSDTCKQLLVMFIRARKPGEDVNVGGISIRRLVSVAVDLRS